MKWFTLQCSSIAHLHDRHESLAEPVGQPLERETLERVRRNSRLLLRQTEHCLFGTFEQGSHGSHGARLFTRAEALARSSTLRLSGPATDPRGAALT